MMDLQGMINLCEWGQRNGFMFIRGMELLTQVLNITPRLRIGYSSTHVMSVYADEYCVWSERNPEYIPTTYTEQREFAQIIWDEWLTGDLK